jgi:hypothetical protein
MRRLILFLLVTLLPLNSWLAVASMRCVHDAQGEHASHAHRAFQADHLDHFGHVDHGNSATHGDHSAQVVHPDTGGHSAAQFGGTTVYVGGDIDCPHADCGGFCHAAGTAAFGVARLPLIGPVFGDAPMAVVNASSDSPSLDGLFRPPRTASA